MRMQTGNKKIRIEPHTLLKLLSNDGTMESTTQTLSVLTISAKEFALLLSTTGL